MLTAHQSDLHPRPVCRVTASTGASSLAWAEVGCDEAGPSLASTGLLTHQWAFYYRIGRAGW